MSTRASALPHPHPPPGSGWPAVARGGSPGSLGWEPVRPVPDTGVSLLLTLAPGFTLCVPRAYGTPRALGVTDVCCALRRSPRKGTASVVPVIANGGLAGFVLSSTSWGLGQHAGQADGLSSLLKWKGRCCCQSCVLTWGPFCPSWLFVTVLSPRVRQQQAAVREGVVLLPVGAGRPRLASAGLVPHEGRTAPCFVLMSAAALADQGPQQKAGPGMAASMRRIYLPFQSRVEELRLWP